MDVHEEQDDIEEEIDNNDDMSEGEVDLGQAEADDQDQTQTEDAGNVTKLTAAALKQQPYEKKSRGKKSVIWNEMELVEVPGGESKLQCKYCKVNFTRNPSGATSHHLRHIKKCKLKYSKSGENNRNKQNVLAFSEGPGEGITSITNFSYDHARVRELASHMLLVHEYSFSMFDHVIFNKFCKAISPFYKKITRQVVKEDCKATVNIERKKLKSVLKGLNRVSVTTDLWKSGQKIQFMVVTGHYVDSNWNLQKTVLNFCNVPPPHTGVIISEALHRCFSEWGIEDKICSITVDNAAYNDVCVRRLKEDFALRKKLSIGGKIFHVRCCAHILNLLVQDGLSQIGDVIDVVRDGIKFLKNSESRLKEFAKILNSLNIQSRKLVLDCPTRWNNTYLMLASASEFQVAFGRYRDVESGFQYVPSDYEWLKVVEVCKFLGVFYEITNLISGSYYPTSNLFLVELYRLKELLNEKLADGVGNIKEMAVEMAKKFDKYWGESNVLMSLAAILDPRYKFVLIDLAFPVIYGENAGFYIADIRRVLFDLFDEYVESHIASRGEIPSRVSVKRKHMQSSGSCSSLGAAKRIMC